MSAPRRWIRLDVDWEDSPWLDALDGTTAGCWPRMLCLVKRSGVAGTMKASAPSVLARRWRVSTEAIEALISAAVKDGALTISGDEWTFPNWVKYQEPDSTNRLRQQAFRDRQRTGKKWSAGLKCEVCGSKKDLTRDHIIPHSHGGTDDPENIRILCRSCNSSRRNNLQWDESVTRDSRYGPVDPVTGAVTRHATETLTLDPTTTSTPRAAVRGKGWKFCPSDWQPSPKHLALALELRLTIERETTAFREWEFKDPKTDADRAFFRWLRTSAERSSQNGNGHKKPTTYPTLRAQDLE